MLARDLVEHRRLLLDEWRRLRVEERRRGERDRLRGPVVADDVRENKDDALRLRNSCQLAAFDLGEMFSYGVYFCNIQIVFEHQTGAYLYIFKQKRFFGQF